MPERAPGSATCAPLVETEPKPHSPAALLNTPRSGEPIHQRNPQPPLTSRTELTAIRPGVRRALAVRASRWGVADAASLGPAAGRLDPPPHPAQENRHP